MASADGTFGIADAVTLYSEQSTTIVNLWTVFAVATFSAAGFSLTNRVTTEQKFGVTIGFLAFAVGHATLLAMCISLQNVLAGEIVKAISTPGKEFADSLRTMVAHRSTARVSFTAHIVIDICVMVVIWFRFTGRRIERKPHEPT